MVASARAASSPATSSQVDDRRDATSAPAARRYFTNAVTEVVVGDERRRRSLHACSARARRRSTSPACRCTPARERVVRVARLRRSAARIVAQRRRRRARRRGRRLHARTASTRRRRRSWSTTTRRIDHAKPHCTSHELYKGILDGKARGVFNGKIIVRQDAQKTDAKQTNKALLLSDDAHDQHQAAARDLRRRREVHARRDDRPARRGRAVLPAGARARRDARRATC